MLSVHNNNYRSFQDLSLFTAFCLYKFPGLSHTFNKLEDSTSYRDELDKLITNLELIQASIGIYKATPHRILRKCKIINFLKITDLKICLLVKNLPPLITTVIAERTQEQSIINDKIDLIERVQNRFFEMKLQFLPNTAAEVKAYFKLKMRELKEGKNPALPSYYHSTENHCFDQILQSRCLKQFDTHMGNGAYISTNIEYETYGPYAFALSANAVHAYSARYFYGSQGLNRKYESTWVRIHHAIPLKYRTVAHITVATIAEKNAIKRRIQGHLNLPVITRAASDCIADLFDDEGCKLRFPKNWTRLSPDFYVPGNIIEFK